jgi:O-antigen ligase
MITWVLGAGQLALAAAGFTAVVVLASRRAVAGLIIVLATFVLFEATAPPLLELTVQFGSVSIYPIDVVSLALLSIGTWRLLTQELYGPAKIALLTLVFLLLSNLVWGIAEFGLEPATNGSRFWFPIVSGVVYGATARDWDRRFVTVLVGAGCLLAGLSIVRLLQHGLHEATTFIDAGGREVDARPVMALGVLVILNALILLLGRGRLTWTSAGLALLLTSSIVLLQYRTLWVTAIAAAVIGGFYLATKFIATQERVVYLLTAFMLLVVPVALLAISRVSVYQESVESATGASSTLTWRLEAWGTLLEKHSSALDLTFGTPSGTDREIVIAGWATNLSAHNVYVEAVLQYGLVGLVALLAPFAIAFRARTATAERLGIAPPTVVVLLTTLVLVSMTHSPGQVQGVVLGALVSAACIQPQPSFERRRVPAPGRELAVSR